MKNGLEVDKFGTKRWYLNGKFHRVGGPAIECADGTKSWYLNGEQHRVDGPAVEYANGTKYWYLNGKQHRVDGPAIEYANGTKYWYLNNEELNCKTQKEFEQYTIDNGVNMEINCQDSLRSNNKEPESIKDRIVMLEKELAELKKKRELEISNPNMLIKNLRRQASMVLGTLHKNDHENINVCAKKIAEEFQLLDRCLSNGGAIPTDWFYSKESK